MNNAAFLTGRLSALTASVAAAVFVSACGAFDLRSERANDRVNPEVPSWFRRPANVMHVDFRRELGDKGKMSGEAYEHGRAEIDPVHNRVFVGSSDHGLYALRASDGSSLWRFATLGAVQSEPVYDVELDIVYFGSHDGSLYAVRAFDGALMFRYATSAEITRRPVVVGETVYFANSADHLYALERRTGKMKWQAQRNPALGMEVAGYAGPAAGNGLVYMAYSDGHVTAYDARTGAERWTPVDLAAEAEQATGETPKYLDVDTTPVLQNTDNGPVVYVASFAGGVYALDARTGARIFANDAAVGVTSLALYTEPAHPLSSKPDEPPQPTRSILLAMSSQSGLWGLDPAANGKALWRVPMPDGGVTEPVAVGGAIAVGTSKYGLFLLSPLNGKVIDGFDVGSGIAQTPAAYGARIFVLTNGGNFLGVRVDAPAGREIPRSDDAKFFEAFGRP